VLTRSATPPADLLSPWLIKTFGSVGMPGYSHLLDDERDQIAALKAAGRSIGAIAKAVGRAKSTVSRELRRNALPSGRSSPLYAAGAYQRRRRREAILEQDHRLRDFVGDRLAEGWTPEQIAGWLKAGHERGLRALGFEAIYAFGYHTAPCALGGASPSTPSFTARPARARPWGAICPAVTSAAGRAGRNPHATGSKT